MFDINTENIENILNDVTQKLDKHHVLLSAIYTSDADPKQFNVPIDNTMNQFNVVIAGESAIIRIFDTKNTIIQNVTETVNLCNVKAYTVNDPTPGTWHIEATSNSPFSVQVTGNSDVLFAHGFSVQPIESFVETTFTPLGGKQIVVLCEKTNSFLIEDYLPRPSFSL